MNVKTETTTLNNTKGSAATTQTTQTSHGAGSKFQTTLDNIAAANKEANSPQEINAPAVPQGEQLTDVAQMIHRLLRMEKTISELEQSIPDLDQSDPKNLLPVAGVDDIQGETNPLPTEQSLITQTINVQTNFPSVPNEQLEDPQSTNSSIDATSKDLLGTVAFQPVNETTIAPSPEQQTNQSSSWTTSEATQSATTVSTTTPPKLGSTTSTQITSLPSPVDSTKQASSASLNVAAEASLNEPASTDKTGPRDHNQVVDESTPENKRLDKLAAPTTKQTETTDRNISSPTNDSRFHEKVSQKQEIHNAQAVTTSPTIANSKTPAAHMAQTPTVGPQQNGAPADVARQLVQIVKPLRQSGSGEYSVTLTLRPETLGKVDVVVKIDNGHVSMQMNCENQGSRDLVRQSLSDLREELNKSGLSSGDLDVSTGGQKSGSNSADSENNTPVFTERADSNDAQESILNGIAASAQQSSGDGSLDIRV